MKNSVKETRLANSITQGDLAKLCGVSRQTIHSIETSKYQPTIRLALKLAKHLNCEVDELFFLEKGD